jgi:hypothetical protein
MAKMEGPPYTGSLVVELTELKADLVDLAPGVLKGARAEQEGFPEVKQELDHAIPLYGDAAEIHPAIHKRIVTQTEVIEKLRVKEAELFKLLEIVRESRGRLENNREDDISAIGTKAEEMAAKGKKPELLAHFEKTIRYKSQIAEKALETRKKNEEAKAAAEKTKAAEAKAEDVDAGGVGNG